MAENQDCGTEPKDYQEGDSCAATVAQNEFSLSLAIANQIQGQVEQGYSASLPEENQVSGVEVKADQEGEVSAAPVSSTEKWSHEAIVARSNMRPVRRKKLNLAANSGENPGFAGMMTLLCRL